MAVYNQGVRPTDLEQLQRHCGEMQESLIRAKNHVDDHNEIAQDHLSNLQETLEKIKTLVEGMKRESSNGNNPFIIPMARQDDSSDNTDYGSS